MEPRSWVTVSSVATASKIGVESSTRARSFMPRSGGHHLGVLEQPPGRAEARSRLRGRPRTVGWKDSAPTSWPARPASAGRPPAYRTLRGRRALEGLEHHHRGEDPGRESADPSASRGSSRRSTRRGTSRGRARRRAVDRPLPQPVPENLPRVLEALLDLRRPQCHGQILFRAGSRSRAFGCHYFSSVLVVVGRTGDARHRHELTEGRSSHLPAPALDDGITAVAVHE